MNSFLFNLGLVLLCVPATINFIVINYQLYMKLTSSSLLFVTILRKMRFFEYFWDKKIFYYAFLIWSILTLIYLLLKPKSDRLDIHKMIQQRKKV